MSLPAMLSLAVSLGVASGSTVSATPPSDSLKLIGAVVAVPSHVLSSAAAAGMSLRALIGAEEAVYEEVRSGSFPGAALAVGRREQVVMEQGIGTTGHDWSDSEVDPDRTVYDLASLTKVVGTTTAVMLLVEDGKIRLDDPVSAYLPEFWGGGKERVTVRHLLTHTSGLPAGASVYAPTPESSLARAIHVPLVRSPGSGVEYSDIGFVVLFAVAERAAGEPVYRLLDRRVFGPLGMRSTTYVPGAGCDRCAPTIRGNEGFRGRVHDPIARNLGGIAGNAGLFSTAHDLARFAGMLASGGELNGVRILERETIRQFTQRQIGAGTRALGWDTPSGGRSSSAGGRISPRAYGHTGFTGTSIWIDPDRGTWTVLLSNRTYDSQANRMQALRRTVNDRVAEASDLGPTAMATGS